MRLLTKEPFSIPYFSLCRKLGTAQVDSMIQARILEVRWTRSITPEEGWVERQWSEDGIERPIVLPMTRMVRKAMEIVLSEEDELEMKEQFKSPSKAQPVQGNDNASGSQDAKENAVEKLPEPGITGTAAS